MGGEMQKSAAMAQVSAQLSRLTLAARPTAYNAASEIPYQRAVRPGLGTQGRPVTVLANHFGLTLKATQAFHYDVAGWCMEAGRTPFWSGRAPRGCGQRRTLRSTPQPHTRLGTRCRINPVATAFSLAYLNTPPPQCRRWTLRAGARAAPAGGRSASKRTVSAPSHRLPGMLECYSTGWSSPGSRAPCVSVIHAQHIAPPIQQP
jgi:hypothetical protein